MVETDNGPIPTKVYCVAFAINGVRVERHVNILRIYENICKPYRTATASMIDNNNVIDNLNLQGGEVVTFIVLADAVRPRDDRNEYSATMKILAIKKQKANYGLRTNYYDIEMIDFGYFGDRANLVQESIKNQVGTQAISMIHGKYVGGNPLEILTPSAGLIGTNNPHIIRSVKPYTAIDQIRRLLTFGSYPSGVSVYFQDNTDVKFAALEYLLDNARGGGNRHYIQRATWGSQWGDVLSLVNGIFVFETTTTMRTQSASVVDKSAAENQEKKIANLFSAKRIFSDMASGGGGGHGGKHNYASVDSEKIKPANTRSTDKENKFRAKVGDGPHITIKVPAQSGFNSTVGLGFSCEIQPPAGDEDLSESSRLSGDYLAIRICHDLHFDSELLQGTSSIEGVLRS